MALIHCPLRNETLTLIQGGLADLASAQGVTWELRPQDIQKLFSTPPQFELGQVAFPCFPWAKSLRLAPPKIAEALADRINTDPSRRYVAHAVAVNGYLNIHAQFDTMGETLVQDVESGAFFKAVTLEPGEKEKILVEYSQPNTHKSMHVGHLRNAVLGEALCRTLENIGHDVVRTTYPGDLGTHVAKVLWYIRHVLKGALPETDFANWFAEIYPKATDAVKQLESTPEGVAVIKPQISEVLRDLQNESGEYYELYLKTREWSLQTMRELYDWLNIHFDKWYFESECDKPSRQLVLRKYEEGFFVKDSGAIGIDLSQWKLGFAMFLKSDGNGNYATKDLELITQKFSDPDVTRSIVVVDFRQKLHFQQVFKTGELMGYKAASRSFHLPYETVNDESGKPCSSRAGVGMRLSDLRSGLEGRITSQFLERYRSVWSDDEIQKTAEKIALGTLKYGMLRVDNNTQIRFVLDEWMRLDGETGPYLQYVYARCRSILERQGAGSALAPLTLPKTFTLVGEHERELAFFLTRFHEFALQAAQNHKPNVISAWLYDLAKAFNRFYENCPIRDAANEDLRLSRLALVKTTAKVMAHGLSLLGIPTVERM